MQYEKLSGTAQGESSCTVRVRVQAARERQLRRFVGTALVSNAGMGLGEVRRHCGADEHTRALLRAAVQQLHLSARGYHRTPKLAPPNASSPTAGASGRCVRRRGAGTDPD